MPWWVPLLQGGLAALGARQQSRTAERSAEAGAAAAEREIGFARESRDLSLELAEPYRQSSLTAVRALHSLTGLPIPPALGRAGTPPGRGVGPGQLTPPEGVETVEESRDIVERASLPRDPTSIRETIFPEQDVSGLSNVWGDIRRAARFGDINWQASGRGYTPEDPDMINFLSENWGNIRRAARFGDIDWTDPSLTGVRRRIEGRAYGGPIYQRAGGGPTYAVSEYSHPEAMYHGGTMEVNTLPKVVSGKTGYVAPMQRQWGGSMSDWTNFSQFITPNSLGADSGLTVSTGADTGGPVKEPPPAPTISPGGVPGVGDPSLPSAPPGLPPGGATPAPQENPGGLPGEFNFQADPGYQFRFSEGMRALERSKAAKGGLLSGGTARQLVRYGQDYASQEYTNVYNRIANLAGYGQVALQGGMNAASGFGAMAGQGAQNAGFYRASGYAQQGNIQGALLEQLGQIDWSKILNRGGGGSANTNPNYGLPGYGGAWR